MTPLEHVAIMGLGIVTALTILQRSSIARVTIFEVRPAPATIGGALNISPNVLKWAVIGYGVVVSRAQLRPPPFLLFRPTLGPPPLLLYIA
jgi:hypothetical protein